VVLLALWDGTVRALLADSGREAWRLDMGGGFASPPMVAGSTLYLASADGVLAAFGAGP
jgi:hypothetical protein